MLPVGHGLGTVLLKVGGRWVPVGRGYRSSHRGYLTRGRRTSGISLVPAAVLGMRRRIVVRMVVRLRRRVAEALGGGRGAIVAAGLGAPQLGRTAGASSSSSSSSSSSVALVVAQFIPAVSSFRDEEGVAGGPTLLGVQIGGGGGGILRVAGCFGTGVSGIHRLGWRRSVASSHKPDHGCSLDGNVDSEEDRGGNVGRCWICVPDVFDVWNGTAGMDAWMRSCLLLASTRPRTATYSFS